MTTNEVTIERLKIIANDSIWGTGVREAARLAIEALEKQNPKKPVYESKMPRCPLCNNWIQNNETIQKYCNFCGQAIDWSDRK